MSAHDQRASPSGRRPIGGGGNLDPTGVCVLGTLPMTLLHMVMRRLEGRCLGRTRSHSSNSAHQSQKIGLIDAIGVHEQPDKRVAQQAQKFTL